jgi:hypothetical protein
MKSIDYKWLTGRNGSLNPHSFLARAANHIAPSESELSKLVLNRLTPNAAPEA